MKKKKKHSWTVEQLVVQLHEHYSTRHRVHRTAVCGKRHIEIPFLTFDTTIMLTVRDLSWHGGRERTESGHQQQTTRRQSGRRHLKSARMKIKTRAARVTCPSSRETIWLPPCGTQGFDSENTAVNDRYGSLHRSSCFTRENREETRICKKLGVRLKLQGFFLG